VHTPRLNSARAIAAFQSVIWPVNFLLASTIAMDRIARSRVVKVIVGNSVATVAPMICALCVLWL